MTLCTNVTLISATRWNAVQHNAASGTRGSRWLTVDTNDYTTKSERRIRTGPGTSRPIIISRLEGRRMCPYSSGTSYGNGSCSPLLIISFKKLASNINHQNMLLIQTIIRLALSLSTTAISVLISKDVFLTFKHVSNQFYSSVI